MMPKKGERMPQTPQQWEYLAGKYEEALIREKEINSQLRITINRLKQQLEKVNVHADT